MSHIFISYSRLDKEFVDRLIRELEQKGFDAWVDQEDIGGGAAWRAAISKAIQESRVFLVVLTPQAVASKNVARELSLADENNCRIIPILYQTCEIPPEIQYQLAGLQWIDFAHQSFGEASNRLFGALGKVGGAFDARASRPEAKPQQKYFGVVPRQHSILWTLTLSLLLLAGVSVWLFWQSKDVAQRQLPLSAPQSANTTPHVEPEPEQLLHKAKALIKEGKEVEAVSLLDRAIHLSPRNLEAYLYRGHAYDKLGNPQRAIYDLDEAIRLNPREASTYDLRGYAYMALKQFPRAIEDYDTAIRLNTDEAYAANLYTNRGWSYHQLQQYRRAIQDYDRAIRLKPDFGPPYYHRGNAKKAIGDNAGAGEDFKKASELGVK